MIDTDLIRQNTDLRALAEADTALARAASTGGGEYAGPCPFCGGTDRFRVQPKSYRWLCRHCTDGKWQDAIDYVQRRDGCDFLTAAKTLGATQNYEPVPRRPRPEPAPVIDTPPDEEWEAGALTAVAECGHALQHGGAWARANGVDRDAPAAARAWHWLTVKRGMMPGTLTNHMIGYNPDWRDVPRVGKLPPGIVIPCWGPDQKLWYVKVRTFRPNLDKYLFLKGSAARALFNAQSLKAATHAVIVEGEFDALLAAQYAPPGVAVVTMGSAGARPGAGWRRYFARLRGAHVALDADAAGMNSAEKWRELVPWLKPMPDALQPGEDITDYYHRAGPDALRDWLATPTAVP